MKHWIAAAMVWPVATLVGGWLFLHTGPALELRFAPVLVAQSIGEVQRAGNRICWEWRYTKARPAVPQTFAWSFTVGGTSVRVPAVVLKASERSPMSAARVRPPGRGDVDLCTTIPDELADVAGVSIVGWAEYETNHTFWTTWQAIPPVRVPDQSGGLPP